MIQGLEVLRQLIRGRARPCQPLRQRHSCLRKPAPRSPRTMGRSTAARGNLALAVSLRDSLRSGDVYLPESRRHVSLPIRSMIPPVGKTNETLPTPNQLPQEPDDFCTRLQREFDEAAGKWHTDCRATTLRPFATTVSIAKSVRPWNCHPGSFTCAAPSRGRCLVSASKTS